MANMVTLWCGVYVKGSVFPVEIALNATVSELQEAIFVETRFREKYTFDGSQLVLYLAKKKDGTWPLSDAAFLGFMKQGGCDDAGQEYKRMLASWKLSKYFGREFEPGHEQIHVLVELPISSAAGVVIGATQTPTAQLLANALEYAKECEALSSWSVSEVYEIPWIWEFFKRLGRCVGTGKLLWRQEDHDVATFLLAGWLGKTQHYEKRAALLVGSPGVGKSTLLCLLAFHAVFKHKKNVFMYRQLAQNGQLSSVMYLGYDEKGEVVYFTDTDFDTTRAAGMYKALVQRHGRDNMWLFLDGMLYDDIPQGLGSFKLLATSQRVDLKSQERDYRYRILHSCWKKKDLNKLAEKVYGWDERTITERFYYSGGSVAEFTRPTIPEIERSIRDAVERADAKEMLTRGRVFRGANEESPLWHMFLKEDTSDASAIGPDSRLERYLGGWVHVIDSEYAIQLLVERGGLGHDNTVSY